MAVAETAEARGLLVDLLHEAAQLEHCLLDAYLYAACSLRSTPQEFATAAGEPNRRRAIQFERARAWKLSLLNVAHEEMLHLHYVQCLLRALGEPPSFALPERDPATGNWIIPNWRARIGEEEVDEGKGVQVPVESLSPANIRRFVVYEATDALQDADPFGPNATTLFQRLHDFEVDLRFESMLLGISDEAKREELKAKLAELYATVTPLPAPPVEAAAAEALAAQLPPVEELRFQSIADFYYRGILPLYEEAFDFGWVTNSNLALNDELLDPNYALEGFLVPIGPIYRDKNFEKFAGANVKDPLRHYKNVADIVGEIVDEGEGAANFEPRAEALLAKVEELGGSRGYLQALLQDQRSPAPTPEWLAEGELLRQSHLYRFATTMVELDQELDLARQSDVGFDPARTPVATGSVALQKLADELPSQLNACYLVLLMWLSRMYEVRNWQSDEPRRLAIEMLASWPLMSIAIRPLLELASFFPVDRHALFRVDAASLPLLPLHAQQLFELYARPERSEEVNERMDYLALHVLTDVAKWCATQAEVVAGEDLEPEARQMTLTRLEELAHLDEFELQYPFRVAGGYSTRMPDLMYQQAQRDPEEFEESPGFGAGNAFADTLALRLRFAGWGLVQLATDPDPPTDEVGCTGTHMFHPADGDRRLDRALVWQDTDPERTILREPRAELPALGVNCADVSLLVAGGPVTAGYVPLSVMQSTGAVQASGVQSVLGVQGFDNLLSLTPEEILGEGRQLRIDLQRKDGRPPILNGYNHLVWQDGEPIDPFVLAVLADPAAGAASGRELLFQREIFNNNGLRLLQMSPLQRLESSRAPCGFDATSNISDWALARLTEEERELLASDGFPISYLSQRAGVLASALAAELGANGDPSQEKLDAIVSLGERMRLVSVPRGTTVGWLTALLHYGHTVSGVLAAPAAENPIFSAFAERLQLGLALAEGADRTAPNARWLVGYTKGVMDTDALSDFVYGELYVPVTVQPTGEPIALSRTWSFPESMSAAVSGYACRFAAPFWAQYQVSGDERTTKLPDGTVLTDTLQTQEADSYTYTTTGWDGVTDAAGTFTLTAPADLTWSFSFKATDPQVVVAVLAAVATAAQQMEVAMAAEFSPH